MKHQDAKHICFAVLRQCGAKPNLEITSKLINLKESTAIRPMSDTAMYLCKFSYFQPVLLLLIIAKIMRNGFKLNQWNSIIRWEFNNPQMTYQTAEPHGGKASNGKHHMGAIAWVQCQQVENCEHTNSECQTDMMLLSSFVLTASLRESVAYA